MKNNVAFAIANFSGCHTGAGGHYYTVKSFLKAFDESSFSPVILVFGDVVPDAFSDVLSSVVLVNVRLSVGCTEIRKTLVDRHVGVIHSFDLVSHFYARRISRLFNIGLVHTKPGGANFRLWPFKSPYYVPTCADIVTFSKENYEYIYSRKSGLGCNVHLIPNRVSMFASNSQRVAKMAEELEVGVLYILRICRIGKIYESSILKSINLAEYLSARGLNARVLCVGKVQDQDVYSKLKESPYVRFFVDKAYYVNASEYIGVTPFYAGMGRGVMEGCSAGRVVFGFADNLDLPVPLDDSVLLEMSESNFSPRVRLDKVDEISNRRAIDKIFFGGYEARMQYSKKVYESRFAISSVIDYYKDIYKKSRPDPSRLDLVLHLVIQVRFLIKFYLKKIGWGR